MIAKTLPINLPIHRIQLKLPKTLRIWSSLKTTTRRRRRVRQMREKRLMATKRVVLRVTASQRKMTRSQLRPQNCRDRIPQQVSMARVSLWM